MSSQPPPDYQAAPDYGAPLPMGTPPQAPPETLETVQARQHVVGGAGWFYWIAALSFINSIVVHSGGEWGFVIGLAITQLVDQLVAMEAQGATALTWFALGFSAVVSGALVLIGYFARRGHQAAFILGILLYTADGLLFLLAADVLGIGFHIFALFFIVRGALATRTLAATVLPT